MTKCITGKNYPILVLMFYVVQSAVKVVNAFLMQRKKFKCTANKSPLRTKIFLCTWTWFYITYVSKTRCPLKKTEAAAWDFELCFFFFFRRTEPARLPDSYHKGGDRNSPREYLKRDSLHRPKVPWSSIPDFIKDDNFVLISC